MAFGGPYQYSGVELVSKMELEAIGNDAALRQE